MNRTKSKGLLRLMLIACVTFISTNVKAQHDVYVTEGRSWIIEITEIDSYDDRIENKYIYNSAIKGDTIINNTAYKKYVMDDKYRWALRQEGKKVYTYDYGEWCKEELLLYDFGLEKDDEFDWNFFFPLYDQSEHCKVVDVDSIEIKGKKYKRLIISNGKRKRMIIEGLGDVDIYPLIGWMFSNNVCDYNVECYYNDELIITYYDIKDMYLGIDEHETQNKTKGIFDLQGRRLNGKPAKGIYIENGKKKVAK